MKLFFALWPDPAIRNRLEAAATQLHEVHGGRRMRTQTLHLTLVFIGELERERLPVVMTAAEGVAAVSFELQFDRTDCWRSNHIAHLGTSQIPPALLELVGQLGSLLTSSGIPFDRRPYVPHITLLRKADCTAAHRPIAAIPWPARDFVLLCSRPSTEQYEILGRWPLL